MHVSRNPILLKTIIINTIIFNDIKYERIT